MTVTVINRTIPTTTMRIKGTNASYTTARSTASSVDFYSYVGQDTVYNVIRAFIKFDTSSIPDTDVISQVNLRMALLEDSSATNFDIVIAKYNWSASDPVSTGNMETVFDGILAADKEANIWRNTSGISLDTYYDSGNLDTTWINKTGITYYGLLSSLDVSNTTPTNESKVGFYYDAGTKFQQLVITHAPAGLANVKTVNGLAIANVKTKNGLAVASIKSINGVT